MALETMTCQIIVGDCRETLKTLPAESVQCCVTSPPYWRLRDYGHAGQIGQESTPELFVAQMVAVFAEVWRVLKNDGTLWLNLGDSYAGTGGLSVQSGKEFEGRLRGRQEICRSVRAKPVGVLKTKDLVGIPWRVAFALQSAGWYLRSDIIWHKPNPMPESITDRPTKAHEYLFLLTKAERYYYNAEAIKEPITQSSIARLSQDVENQEGSHRVPGKTNVTMKAVGSTGKNAFRGQGANREAENGANNREGRDMSDVDANADGTRNKRTVWTIPTRPCREAHFATFPPDLVKPCILAGTRPGDTVLDPFGGSGTSGEVAISLGRSAILCELNPKYAKLAETRATTTIGLAL